MDWQGIPYLLVHNSTRLDINKLPTIVVDSGFAWENVIGAVIAGSIPAFIAWYTIKKNMSALKEDRDAQLDIASKNIKAQVLSGNRQQWINSLREATAEYIAAVHAVRKSRTMARHCLSVSKKEGTDFVLTYRSVIEAMTKDAKELERLKYKILLLINPLEPEAIEIDRILKKVQKNSGSFDERPNKKKLYTLTKELVSVTQRYLKKEWVRVKDVD